MQNHIIFSLLIKIKILTYQGAIDDAGGSRFWTTDLNQSTNFVKKVINDIKSNKPCLFQKRDLTVVRQIRII